MKLNSISEIIQDIREGRMVILMDDEDRENEGDLIMAASKVTADDVNFMARFGRGLICLTLTRERCEQLDLPLMVSGTDENHTTNFTLSIEAAEGVTTGISAADRAVTIQAAVAHHAKPEDIVQPGHIFPLMAQPGGVLTRAGHTEAGCDLARLAGLEPASVIVEILNEDGTMARRPDLEKFAKEHNLKIGTVADLIHYRIENESTIEMVGDSDMPTEFGHFHLYAYRDTVDGIVHFALVNGEVKPDQPVTVRVHIQDSLSDLVRSTRAGGGFPLSQAMKMIAEGDDPGIVLILRRHEDDASLIKRINEFHREDHGDKVSHPESSRALRTYGVGAQILADRGVRKMRVIGSPLKLTGLEGFGLEITEYITY